MQGRRILLIVGGGIAAYKAPALIRLLRAEGVAVTPVLTRAGAEFVTPMVLSVLAGEPVQQDLFDASAEAEIGHIQLSRRADLVVVAPVTADLMAKMAGGQADDLASTLLLATDKPVLIAPAMNVRMWDHRATRRNLATLSADGVLAVGPEPGEMACGEYGMGRMAEPETILEAVRTLLGGVAPGAWAGDRFGPPDDPLPDDLLPDDPGGRGEPGAEAPLKLMPAAKVSVPGPLAGRHVIVTSGPTHEPIDPVRYIANRSSGAQGTAIAAALRDLGARVSFVTGPASVPPPEGVEVIAIETAREMRAAVEAALPADAAVMAAAVADWRVANASGQKIKKDGSGNLPVLEFAENPDILAWVSQLPAGQRPGLVVGFAAETHDVLANATAKRRRKGCDWIVANDVSPETGIMGGSENAVTLIAAEWAEDWPRMGKDAVAARLASRIAAELAGAPA